MIRGLSVPGLRFEGSFDLAGSRLFEGVTLRLEPGTWTCLLGPSGVGKSTILRLLAGLGTGGSFDGRLEADDGQPLAGRLAYMAQADLLPAWLDVEGCVTLGARLRGEAPDLARARDLIARVGLTDHAHKRPAALSGGMRQRAALARTLMEDRPFALLDEPFSALDAGTRADMQELAFELLAGRSVLLVTHDPAEAVRLGHLIYLMTPQGLQIVDPPQAAPLRDPAASETLRAQADLLALLRRRQAA
ncbi:MAG: ATP-binding cassette domain-containing protein [Rhodospirillales bacterium]